MMLSPAIAAQRRLYYVLSVQAEKSSALGSMLVQKDGTPLFLLTCAILHIV